MVALVFVTSGYSHLKDPTARAKSIGMPKPFTIFLGIAEVSGGLGVAFGILTQLAAFGLILIMFGAIQKKFSSGTPASGVRSPPAGITIFMIVLMNLVIAFTNGGAYVLTK